jgi:hypothetical protein
MDGPDRRVNWLTFRPHVRVALSQKGANIEPDLDWDKGDPYRERPSAQPRGDETLFVAPRSKPARKIEASPACLPGMRSRANFQNAVNKHGVDENGAPKCRITPAHWSRERNDPRGRCSHRRKCNFRVGARFNRQYRVLRVQRRIGGQRGSKMARPLRFGASVASWRPTRSLVLYGLLQAST